MTCEITVDGKPISLSAFPEEIIGNVAIAMAESLRGVDGGWKEIVIKVKKEE